MDIIRPIHSDDLKDLIKLAKLTSYGMSSLPDDEEILQKRILKSKDCFAKKTDEPRGETYLFALENLDKGKMIGVSGIVSKVGVGEPFYTYKIETAIHESEKLKVRKEIQVLTPVPEHNGPCEIGSLYLSPENRKSGLGRFLSLSRFLFMAEYTTLFDPIVIAKMRGVIEKDGSSAFWDSVGKHFFDINYAEANYLSMINKQFIAELLPKYPIYIQLLPEDAQKVIGKVHKNTKPALKILMDEGFKYDNRVSIFAAGPILCCNIRDIRSVKESIKTTVAEIKDKKIKSELFIISNASMNYHACLGHVKINSSGAVQLEKKAATALKVKVGDPVRFVPLYPSHHHITKNREKE
ncbi:MAG: arginine N-succinyltransferase [Candidatus Scalindua sp.]|nr:arginine N-succinyltransferase [Candidatus Scalindua sp.]